MCIACWIPKPANTHLYLLLSHCNGGCTNAPQCRVVSCVHCLSCFLFSDICNVSKKRGQMAHAPGPVRTDKTRGCQGTVFGCFERDTENYSLLCIGRSQERCARGVEFKHTIFRPPLVVIVLLMTHICHHV
jgi:hypothetical protein